MSCRPLYVPVVMFVMVVFYRVKSRGHNLAAPPTEGMDVDTFATISAATIINIAAFAFRLFQTLKMTTANIAPMTTYSL